jgi:ubiquitin-protein ligase
MSRNKRILKEIDASSKSDMFEFFDDTEGKFGEKNACYIRFWVNQGSLEGQVHILELRFIWGSNVVYKYPKKPMMIRFVTPVYHTNISTTGSICLDVIKDSKWSPMYSVETVYNSIIALMEDPNHSSPFNGTASRDCKNMDPVDYQVKCMEYYMKNMQTQTYERALPLLTLDEYVTGVSEERLEIRSKYLRSLMIALGLAKAKEEEVVEVVDASGAKGKEEEVPIRDDIPNDSSDE